MTLTDDLEELTSRVDKAMRGHEWREQHDARIIGELKEQVAQFRDELCRVLENMQTPVLTCRECDGTGEVMVEIGTGRPSAVDPMNEGVETHIRQCDRCLGTGHEWSGK